MNILIIPSWYPQFEGDSSGSFFKEQAELLSMHYPEHHFMVIHCCLSFLSLFKLRFLKRKPEPLITIHPKTSDNLTEITISRLWAVDRFKPERKAAKYIANLLKTKYFQPDIIHAHVTWNAGYIAMELATLLSCPYIITEHMGPFPWETPLFIKKSGQLTSKIKKPLKKATRVIAVSHSLANKMASYGFQKPSVIPNLVNEGHFTPYPAPRKADTFNLLSIGALNPEKGMDCLLKAFADAQQKITPLRLTIIGKGDEEKALRSLAQALKIDEYVNFQGVVNRSEIVDYYHQADCFILPSRGETFGIVYAEAIACGLPIIATKCGGPEDIVNDTNGILGDIDNIADISEAIIHVYENLSTFNAKLIREDFLRRFSSKKVCEQIVQQYHQAIGS